jgi:hypothetical protein
MLAARPALAEDTIVTLMGDPAVEAREREELFAALAASANAAEAQSIAAKVWALWFRAPNPDAATLMKQALEHRGARDYSAASAVLDELIESQPDWAEA